MIVSMRCVEGADAVPEALFPVRNFDAVGFLDFGLVQHGVVRTSSRCWIFLSVERTHFAVVDASDTVNCFREVVPRNHALV